MEDLENVYAHIPNKNTLKKINNLSPKDLYERYITKNTTPEIDPADLWKINFREEVLLKDPSKPDFYKWSYTGSLSNEQLFYIRDDLKCRVLPFLPKELKINASNIFEDLEKILLENRKLTLTTKTINDYIRNLSDFFTNSLKTAIAENVKLETPSTDYE